MITTRRLTGRSRFYLALICSAGRKSRGTIEAQMDGRPQLAAEWFGSAIRFLGLHSEHASTRPRHAARETS